MPSDLFITCKYSCHQCSLYRVNVKVRPRQDEDVVAWLDSAARVMGADHDRRSPHCYITKLDEVLIPMPPGTTKVGGLIEN